MTAPGRAEAVPDDPGALAPRLAKLERINAALMAHVERTMDQQGGAYALFQTAIMLEGRVRARTEELTGLMRSLERSNLALAAAKEEAETANRSKTRFLAAASHDLMQPVNAARLSLSALADLPLAPEAGVIMGQVERGLQTIEDLIKTLLDISKLDAGIVRPVVGPVRLRDAIRGIAGSFRPFAERKALRLVARCDPDLVVATDAALLQRILQNLVSNAIRYTEAGGVLVAGRRCGGGARVDVVDTGRGIAQAERDLVFEEFYRGRDEDGETGLGLGLAIVRRTAAALGHDLVLASRPGHGTRLSLTLPRAAPGPGQEAGDVPARAAPVTTRLTGARLLIVENDAATAQALKRLLQGWDARVETQRDLAGVAAALDAGGPAPDLVIADYHLDDGACGLDVVAHLRRVRAGRTAAALPVIVTTADHAPEIEARVLATGAEFLRKPVKPAQLRSLLVHMLA